MPVSLCIQWVVLLSLIVAAKAKHVSGKFRLSGLESHAVLCSFAVLKDGGRVHLEMTASNLYENERFLKFRLYRDVEWPRFQQARTCQDRTRYAQQTLPVSINYSNGQWKSNTIDVLIVNTPGNMESSRPHYWYVVIDDCSLEQVMQDDSVPLVDYKLDILNNIHDAVTGITMTHLSADEVYLETTHWASLAFSGIVAFALFMRLVNQVRYNTLHLAVIWLCAAASLDAASSACELMHIAVYKRNGIGSYLMDALSAHCEAACDGLLSLGLWALAAGWTLPSDLFQSHGNPSILQRVTLQMRHPIQALREPAGIVAVAILAVYIILAQWGRMYNTDFESYHDLEHWPGRLQMIVRMILAVLFVVACNETRWTCQDGKVRGFFWQLLVVGTLWFISMPMLTLICARIPYYLRHPAVYGGSAFLQSACLLMLAGLVSLQSTVYQKASRLNASNSEGGSLSMVGQQTKPSTWTVGRTKIRLD
jgi:GNAT superfamily N-acetyltransferase